MGKMDKILSGQRILEKINSSINGELTVIRDLAWGTYIQDINGLTQSGGVAETVWKTSLKKVKNNKQEFKNVLILGLGGGGIAKLVRKNWPDSEITGVDIDPVIVDLGRKYMKLDKYEIETFIEDAGEFIEKCIKNKTKFDLICIDMYVQDDVPEKFNKDEFLKKIKSTLDKEGVAVFNRLYYGEKRPRAIRYGDNLKKVFGEVDVVFPEANVMFLVSK